MSRCWAHKLLVHSDVSIVLFVDIEVLNDTLAKEVLEVFESECQVLYVSLHQLGSALLANDQWPNKSASISSNVDAIHLLVVVDRDELLDATTLPKQAHVANELCCLLVYSHRLTIEPDEYMLW